MTSSSTSAQLCARQDKTGMAKVANLDEIAQHYAGSKGAIEAISNYFTIYDALAEHLMS